MADKPHDETAPSEAYGAPNHYETKEELENTTHEATDAQTSREETQVHAQPPKR